MECHWSNKPMEPTAPTAPATNPLRPMWRHTGQSLGALREEAQCRRKNGQR